MTWLMKSIVGIAANEPRVSRRLRGSSEHSETEPLTWFITLVTCGPICPAGKREGKR